MMRIGILAAAAVALCLTAPARAQTSPDPEAQKNVRESGQYEKLVCSNAAFRAQRIAQECGSLKDSQFYSGCVASFDCGKGAPAVDPKGLPASEKIH